VNKHSYGIFIWTYEKNCLYKMSDSVKNMLMYCY